MENISDKEVTKKKKRRKRKKSSAVKTVVKTEVKETKVKVEEKKFNTAELEIIKEEISENLDNSRQIPQHMFSIKNLFMTVLVTCVIVLLILAGYLAGVFYTLDQEPEENIDFGNINAIEEEKISVEIADYEFKVPTGYQVVESESLLKVNDISTGYSVEVLELLNEAKLYEENTIDEYRNELNSSGYTIYASYILDEFEEKFLVYTGVDNLGSEFRVVYSPLKADMVAKFLVTSEYDRISDEVYNDVNEMRNK